MPSAQPTRLEGIHHASQSGHQFSLGRDELESIYLSGLQERFSQLKSRVPALRKLHEEQGVHTIRRVDDVVPLLFPHTIFKSYPLSLLDNGDFGKLTRWLGALTTTDLTHVKCDHITSIDDWIDHLDRVTPLRLLHSFGTGGKLSFMPRTKDEYRDGARRVLTCMRNLHGENSGPDLVNDPRTIIQPTYRWGASPAIRGVETMVEVMGPCEVIYLYPEGRFSADVASLAGRLRAAEARGEQGQLSISASLRARQQQFREQEAQRPRLIKEFHERVERELAGRDVYLFGVWPVLYDWAKEGLARNLQGVFGPGTLIHSGGGTKGRALPEGWRDEIFRFIGSSQCFEFYAMTEMIPACPRCEEGNYHVPPTLVPFLLDPDTGAALPRDRVRRGRFAYVDLLAGTYWGGIVTGDELTLAGWDAPCACGRLGPYIEPTITRFSLERGGDDKINCAGAPEAHDQALEYIAALAAQ